MCIDDTEANSAVFRSSVSTRYKYQVQGILQLRSTVILHELDTGGMVL
jgi:hypothetical protein